MTKPSPIEVAKSIKEAAVKHGFTLEVRGGILTVHSRFQGGEVNEWFRNCDMSYYSVLGLLPRTEAGSDWGTDGGSIGGMAAINSGAFKMNRSGGSKRVLAALVKLGA
jgi:hypothetical protein